MQFYFLTRSFNISLLLNEIHDLFIIYDLNHE